MGGCCFTTFQKGFNAKEAYTDAVAAAAYEHGHGGYTGTISETSGYNLVLTRPMTLAGANLWADAHFDDCEKWGPAEAVPIADDSEFNFKTVKSTITLPGTITVPYGGEKATSEWDLREAAKKKLFEQYSVKGFQCQIHKIDIATKIETEKAVLPAKGNWVSRYRIGGGLRRNNHLYETKAKAISAAKTAAAPDDNVQIEVVRYWPEENTTSAFVVKSITKSAHADITITLAEPKDARAMPVSGYFFYGIASI